jgi:hypothetical protein
MAWAPPPVAADCDAFSASPAGGPAPDDAGTAGAVPSTLANYSTTIANSLHLGSG